MNELEKLNALRDELREHNHNYYILDAPVISDFEFDLKLKELQALEAKFPEYADPNSPSVRVGGAVTKNFKTVKHTIRMYSLDNSYSKDELLDWEQRVHKNLGNTAVSYTCELKYDGASISLSYENGRFCKSSYTGGWLSGR